jgi:broad specificity phosphatase PhoE
MSESLPRVYLARHGETPWTISRQHTGRTEIPLTTRGEADARSLGQRLKGDAFDLAFVSPLGRARRTCELAGFGARARVDADMLEWEYGEYEGRTTAEIRAQRANWFLFRDGCPGGESVAAVGARADRVVTRLRGASGRIILFGHGHFFRVLTARWLGLPPGDARHYFLGTSALSVLGYEHSLDEPVLLLWNDDRHAVGAANFGCDHRINVT